jgi:hypothetical protein
MAATDFFPLAPWLEGTNQNSTPANDNALRMEALIAPASGFAAAAPGSPADHDQWVVSVTWGGFSVGNVVIFLGGTWKEFAAFDGLIKVINGVLYRHASGAWAEGPLATVAAPSTATSTGIKGQIAYDATHFYVCIATNTWVRASLATW